MRACSMPAPAPDAGSVRALLNVRGRGSSRALAQEGAAAGSDKKKTLGPIDSRRMNNWELQVAAQLPGKTFINYGVCDLRPRPTARV